MSHLALSRLVVVSVVTVRLSPLIRVSRGVAIQTLTLIIWISAQAFAVIYVCDRTLGEAN